MGKQQTGCTVSGLISAQTFNWVF